MDLSSDHNNLLISTESDGYLALNKTYYHFKIKSIQLIQQGVRI